MVHTSDIADPKPFVDKVNQLAEQQSTIDESVYRVKSDAEKLAKNDPSFEIIAEFAKSATDFYDVRWVNAVKQTRGAASSIAAWYQTFIGFYLSNRIDSIKAEADIKGVVGEFESLVKGEYPSKKFNFDGVSGVKEAFNEIEGLVHIEGKRIIEVLGKATSIDWQKVVEGLKKELVPVKDGAEQIRKAMKDFATKV